MGSYKNRLSAQNCDLVAFDWNLNIDFCQEIKECLLIECLELSEKFINLTKENLFHDFEETGKNRFTESLKEKSSLLEWIYVE